MQHNKLVGILGHIFGLHKSRLFCLSEIITGLIKVRSVNLNKIATSFSSKASIKSTYRRLQRFFKSIKLDKYLLARLIAQMFEQEAWLLSMDRTNWKFGKTNINILTLAISYKGVGIPIFWMLLDKQGASNTNERKQLLRRFVYAFGSHRITSLLMDREFDGNDWLGWLQKQAINFTLRLKENVHISSSKGNTMKVKFLLGSLKHRKDFVSKELRSMYGQQLYLSAMRGKTGEWIYLATNHEPKQAPQRYRKRWHIETMFGFMKTKGFDLEATHLRDYGKLDTLIGIITISFAWVHLLGEQEAIAKPPKIKNHGFPEKSRFKLGLEFMTTTLLNLKLRWQKWIYALQLFVQASGLKGKLCFVV